MIARLNRDVDALTVRLVKCADADYDRVRAALMHAKAQRQACIDNACDAKVDAAKALQMNPIMLLDQLGRWPAPHVFALAQELGVGIYSEGSRLSKATVVMAIFDRVKTVQKEA